MSAQLKNQTKKTINLKQNIQPDLRTRALANQKLPIFVNPITGGQVTEKSPFSWSSPNKLIARELISPNERDGERSLEQYVIQE